MEIEKRAYHEGYEQGTQNGYEDGYKEAYEDNIEKAKNESSEIIDKANKIMLEANNQVASYIKIIKKYFSYGNIYCGKGAKKKF